MRLHFMRCLRDQCLTSFPRSHTITTRRMKPSNGIIDSTSHVCPSNESGRSNTITIPCASPFIKSSKPISISSKQTNTIAARASQSFRIAARASPFSIAARASKSIQQLLPIANNISQPNTSDGIVLSSENSNTNNSVSAVRIGDEDEEDDIDIVSGCSAANTTKSPSKSLKLNYDMTRKEFEDFLADTKHQCLVRVGKGGRCNFCLKYPSIVKEYTKTKVPSICSKVGSKTWRKRDILKHFAFCHQYVIWRLYHLKKERKN
eukprot:513793_1